MKAFDPIKAGCCIDCGRPSRLLVCDRCDRGSPAYAAPDTDRDFRGGDRRWNGEPLVKVPLADHLAGLGE